jgi:PPOX class probable F420-dependent enzyme
MTADEARSRFAVARVARLATADPGGRPHLVPITFAIAGDVVYHAVDAKPKRTLALRRLANIAANPRVCLLVDHYDDADWRALWWARADGSAGIVEGGRASLGVELLVARYAQYRASPPQGPVVAVAVERWSGWSAAG